MLGWRFGNGNLVLFGVMVGRKSVVRLLLIEELCIWQQYLESEIYQSQKSGHWIGASSDG
jgi:hypothetical protein